MDIPSSQPADPVVADAERRGPAGGSPAGAATPSRPSRRSSDRVTVPFHRGAGVDAVLSADRTPIYNTAAVARRSGVPPATFRAWERRYGFPSPGRNARNRRGYSEQDVLALHWLRDRLAEGLTISAAVTLLREHLARPAPPPMPTARPPSGLAANLEQALLAFDVSLAERLLSEAFALYPLERVCLEVVQPVLVGIGEGWHAGRIDVGQEHFASALIRQQLAALFRLADSPRASRLAVAAAAPGEWHELGLLMVALFLARRGWHVVYLGPSLPSDDLLSSLAHLRPDAVVLSAAMAETAAALAELARRLAERPASAPLVAFGGRAFEADPGLRNVIPALYLGPSAATAAERLDQVLPATGR